MTDIVERLGEIIDGHVTVEGDSYWLDEITQAELLCVRDEITRLRDALASIKSAVEPYSKSSALSKAVFLTARNALEGKDE